jgi:GrpB-like predicted nucleotidyltransferase (UPF0157 family)
MAGYLESLANLGYAQVALGPFDLVYPFFQKPGKWPSTHHVRLCVAGSVQERDHLAFRNYLRRYPPTAAEYVALKRQLAASHDGATLQSRERYSLAKTGFVTAVLGRALADGYALPDQP